jgi:uncharacterized protein (DUF305 family)
MFGTYQRLHVSVHASNREVIKAASKKLKPKVRYAYMYRDARHEFYRNMLAHHAMARDLANQRRL